MAIEIEKKYKLDKKLLVELTSKLSTVGAVFAYENFEENYLHRGGVLDERGAVLRIRKTREKTLLTYKEKVPNQTEFKQQIEHETTIGDVDAVEAIIQKLGYKLSAVYEKHRKAWHLGNCEVVLDELPFGYYMEIEGTIEDITEAEKLLGVEHLELEPRGYPRLTSKLGVDVNGVMESRFAKTQPA
ncbi:MAG: class IV adenylate cyclase [Blastocatellia bacterium]|nr:class IV adenylate cyclase [Blastocatellia bacterium]